MIIGLCGITFYSVNYGVSALAYSQISVIHDCAKELGINPTYYVFSMDQEEKVQRTCTELGIDNIRVFESARYKTGIAGVRKLKKAIAQCDIVFDVTKGDSFSDIYGYKRYILQAIEKYFAVKKSQLVISPQTIGPFANKVCEKAALYFINNSMNVFARDCQSADCVTAMDGSVTPVVTSDLAFYLPFTLMEKKNVDGKKHIGINVSGLIWQGGYTGKNEFGLKCDYKKYTMDLIERLLADEMYRVHLIAHVYMESGDGDYQVCEKLKNKYPDTILAPKFETPIEAKSYFSSLDALVGARMHATIGAISAGIVSIPVSYSRKFEGLYGSLDYPYVIQATQWDTEQCLSNTLQYIEDMDAILPRAAKAVAMAKEKNNAYIEDVFKNLKNLSGR